MIEREEIQQAIRDAVDRFNAMLPPEKALPSEPGTVLTGAGGALDSLGFVNLAVALEEGIQGRFGREISVIDIVAELPPNDLTLEAVERSIADQLNAAAPER